MSKPTLFALATQFHQRLKSIKDEAPLDHGLTWYPWISLAAFQILDEFLKGDVDALRDLTRSDPVLDVGCGDGDVAFFLESLGLRVDTVDHVPTNYNAMLGVRTLKRLLHSGVAIHTIDLDERPNLPSSNYGLTVMLGVLYHLKNPFLVLETLARHSRHILLSTRIASTTPDRKFNFGAQPMAYLVDEDELNDDPTNFWIFSEPGLKLLVERSGWTVRKYTTVGGNAASADPVSPKGDVRAYLLAESRVAPPSCGFHLERGWHRLEHGGWRWTQRRFSVQLMLSSPLAPATLRFRFTLPERVLALRPNVTLAVKTNGVPLEPRTFTTPGEHEYTGTVPSLAAGAVSVEFELDSALVPADGELRELGGILVDFAGPLPVALTL
jgi:tRNA (mo5U34)-methyltransferase